MLSGPRAYAGAIAQLRERDFSHAVQPLRSTAAKELSTGGPDLRRRVASTNRVSDGSEFGVAHRSGARIGGEAPVDLIIESYETAPTDVEEAVIFGEAPADDLEADAA